MAGREDLLPAHGTVGDLHLLQGVPLDLAGVVPPDLGIVEAAVVQNLGEVRKDLHRGVDPHQHHLLPDPDHGDPIVKLNRRIAARKRMKIERVMAHNFIFADILYKKLNQSIP